MIGAECRIKPDFICESKSAAQEMALGYCAKKTVGCLVGEMALKIYDPLGISSLAGDVCEIASDKIMGLDYDIGDFVADTSFKFTGWYLAATKHPILAMMTWVAGKGYSFYGCQEEVSTKCAERYDDWQRRLRKYEQCMSS